MKPKTYSFAKIESKEVQHESLIFYSYYKCIKSPKEEDCINFKKNNPEIKYPCLILMRVNNWNDYKYYTNFDIFYLPNKDEVIELGIVKIIQSKAKDFYTILPDKFEQLSKNEFFSRGTLSFYNELKSLEKIKNIILSSLNDIYYHHYTKEGLSKIDMSLLVPYEQSLFRDDFYDLDVASEYAKNSLNMLYKIKNCVASLSKLDENNQKVIRKLLYGSVITALESYLGDAFKYHVINNKSYFYSFLKNYDFKGEKKYDLNELGLHGNKIGEFIENRIKEIMNNIIFHKIELVNELYKQILNIDLLPMIMDFREAIQKRHDIFHRNGKNITGIDLNIQSYDILTLISQVKKFISETECIMAAQI